MWALKWHTRLPRNTRDSMQGWHVPQIQLPVFAGRNKFRAPPSSACLEGLKGISRRGVQPRRRGTRSASDGREVTVVLSERRLLPGTFFCTNPYLRADSRIRSSRREEALFQSSSD